MEHQLHTFIIPVSALADLLLLREGGEVTPTYPGFDVCVTCEQAWVGGNVVAAAPIQEHPVWVRVRVKMNTHAHKKKKKKVKVTVRDQK